jgi:imidazolonepropionase-like amidohydrolase
MPNRSAVGARSPGDSRRRYRKASDRPLCGLLQRFYRDLRRSFPVILACIVSACETETAERPEAKLIDDGTVAFTGASIWDGRGSEIIEDAVLLLRDGRVVEIGTGIPPAGTRKVELDGMWIVPGFINSHGHVSGRWAPAAIRDTSDRVAAELALYSHYGITTVLSLGDEPREAFSLRDSQNAPGPDRARIFLAGPVVADENPHEAAAHAADNVVAGVDWLKVRVDDNLGTADKMPWSSVAAVLAVGAKTGTPVATHIFYYDDALRLVESGSSLIAHSVRDRDVDQAFIEAILEAGTCYVPTLVREVSTFVYAERPAFFDDPFFLEAADLSEMSRVTRPAHMAEVAASPLAAGYRKALQQAQKNLGILQAAGVPIAFGTDSGPPGRFPGYFEHMEFALMSEAGLSPEQILRSATSVAADCLRLDDVGTLEEGKRADFLVLEANPLDDIAATRSIRHVYIGGNELRRELR